MRKQDRLELELGNFWIKEIIDPSCEQSCFKILDFNYEYDIFTGVTSSAVHDPSIVFYSKINQSMNQIFHHIAKKREDLLTGPPLTKPNAKSPIFGWSGTYLLGNRLIFSEDGNKASAFAPSPHGTIVKVSTDTEILKHTNSDNHDIYWYYDPA